MKISHATWTEVEAYLKNDSRLIIPIGSTEQHGPTGLIGTDFLTAESIAEEVGNKIHCYVAPSINYGMALHHMDFPGTASLKPSTLLLVVKEVVESFKKHGFRQFYFINGHGGNIPTVTAAFSEIKCHDDRSVLELFNWWRLEEVSAYENHHFGSQNGFHATVGEVSVTMHIAPDAFTKIMPQNYAVKDHKSHWPLSPVEFREHYPDGRMGSNPGLASKEHGEKLFKIAVDTIAHRISSGVTSH